MTYNSIDPDPTIAIADVRIATGNLLPEDYPDAQIVKKIKSAYSKIQLGVRRELNNPFLDTDTAKEHCAQLEISLAAMFCLKAYGPEFLDKVQELRTETTDDIVFMQEALGITIETLVEEETFEEGIMDSTDPKGWYKNPEVGIPNRMKPYRRAGDIEGLGVARLDPDLPLS
jgi:hypothetical protein